MRKSCANFQWDVSPGASGPHAAIIGCSPKLNCCKKSLILIVDPLYSYSLKLYTIYEFKFRTFRIRSKEEQKMISRMIKTEADKMISRKMGQKPHSVQNRLSLCRTCFCPVILTNIRLNWSNLSLSRM